jgi:MFS family permease
MRKMQESRGDDTGLDLVGLALVATSVLGLVWGLVRGNIDGWGSAEVLGALSAGVLLGVLFVASERHASEPMLPLVYFRSRAFSAGNAAIFCTFGSLFACVFFYPQLLQIAMDSSPLDAGLKLLPWTATFITIAPAAGALTDRIGERPLMVSGLLLQAAGASWLAAIAHAQMPYDSVLGPFLMAGVGISIAIPAAQNSVVGSISAAHVGKAAGVNSMMRELGGVFGIAVSVAAFAGAGGYGSPTAFADGFAPAVWVAAAIALVGAVCGLALPSRARQAIVPLALGLKPEEAG